MRKVGPEVIARSNASARAGGRLGVGRLLHAHCDRFTRARHASIPRCSRALRSAALQTCVRPQRFVCRCRVSCWRFGAEAVRAEATATRDYADCGARRGAADGVRQLLDGVRARLALLLCERPRPQADDWGEAQSTGGAGDGQIAHSRTALAVVRRRGVAEGTHRPVPAAQSSTRSRFAGTLVNARSLGTSTRSNADACAAIMVSSALKVIPAPAHAARNLP